MAAPEPIPFHVSDVGPAEVAAATACLAGGQLAGDGPLCRQVEAALAGLTGSRHVLLVTSATHALELAFMALDIRPGDEVILPSFTFPSAANAILQRGARPVFADVRADTLELDAADVRRVLTSRTAAVLPVDYAGTGTNLQALRDVLDARARSGGAGRTDARGGTTSGHADARGSTTSGHADARSGAPSGARGGAGPGARRIALVEDAAQGIDSWRDGVHVGTGADCGALSFHATKNISCGEGGALLVQDDALFRRAEIMREKGTNRAAFQRGEVSHYEWVSQGSSFVLSDLLAAVLQAQLGRLQQLTAARRALAARYDEAFADLFAQGVLRPLVTPRDARPNAHLYALRTRDAAAQQALRAHLAARGIEAPFHFVPLHTTDFARRMLGPPRHLPVTDDAWATLLRLPLYPRLTEDAQQRIIDAVCDWAGRT